MDSVAGCAPEGDGQCSGLAGKRVASAWLPDIATFQPLRTSKDFDLVFSQGKRRRVGGITVHWTLGDSDTVRIGLVASRKVGGAVIRNRVKRRLRAALGEVGRMAGGDYVIVASRHVAKAPYSTVVGWLRTGLAMP